MIVKYFKKYDPRKLKDLIHSQALINGDRISS